MRNRLAFFLLLVLVSFMCLVGFFLFSSLFNISEVSVNDPSRFDEVMKYAGVRLGSNIFMFNQFEARKRILEHDKQVEDVKVIKHLPSRVEFVLKLKKPVMLHISDELYGLTRKGELIRLETKLIPNLPIFTGYNLVKPHTFLPDSVSRLLFALYDTLEQYFPEFFMNLSEINWDQQAGLGFYIINNALFVRIGRDRFTIKLSRLERVLKELENSRDEPFYIDLDFTSQVIVRYKSQKGEG